MRCSKRSEICVLARRTSIHGKMFLSCIVSDIARFKKIVPCLLILPLEYMCFQKFKCRANTRGKKLNSCVASRETHSGRYELCAVKLFLYALSNIRFSKKGSMQIRYRKIETIHADLFYHGILCSTHIYLSIFVRIKLQTSFIYYSDAIE